MSEGSQQGCLTLLGVVPVMLGGHLCGGSFAVLALVGAILGLRSRSIVGVGLGLLGLLAGLAGLASTVWMHVDASNWGARRERATLGVELSCADGA